MALNSREALTLATPHHHQTMVQQQLLSAKLSMKRSATLSMSRSVQLSMIKYAVLTMKNSAPQFKIQDVLPVTHHNVLLKVKTNAAL